LKPGEKNPAERGWLDNPLDRAGAGAVLASGGNVGILTGAASSGLVDVDLDDATAARWAVQFLPPTGAVFGRAGRPGSHWLYVSPGMPRRTIYQDPVPDDQHGAGLILEVRSDGHQTMFPGSVHPSGERVEWAGEGGEPAVVEPTALLARAGELAAAVLLAHHSPRGGRHDAALYTAGALLNGGWDASRAETFVETVCRMAGDTEELEDRMRAVASTVERREDGNGVAGWPKLATVIDPRVVKQARKWLGLRLTSKPLLTDSGNADRLVDYHGHELRHVALWGKWLVYRDGRWQEDRDQEIVRRAIDTARTMLREASEEQDKDKRDKLARHAIASENGNRLRAMVSLASANREIAVVPEALDRDPWLLNCRNGTLDLRTGTLRPHDPDDLLTKQAPVVYDPDAACPLWTAYLSHAQRGDSDMLGFLQRLVGLCLTGITTEKVLPILHGPSNSGKTTFTKVILALLGEDYAQIVAETTVSRKDGADGIPDDVARLRGVRFALVSETGEGMQLNEARIKAYTGRNRISARKLYGEWFEFDPEFKLIIETNNKPHIRENSTAVWNRIKLVPFTVVLPEAEQDKALIDKMVAAELPGILAWAVEGCRAWQRDGLGQPAQVTEATAEYQGDSDTLAAFLAECCEVVPDVKERSGTVYAFYQGWMRERGQHALGDQRFTSAVKDRGFVKKESKGIAYWRGLRLRDGLTGLTPVPINTPTNPTPDPFESQQRGADGA